MGSGANIALFDDNDAEVTEVTYVRVKRVGYFFEALNEYEDVYEEGPYDSVLTQQ